MNFLLKIKWRFKVKRKNSFKKKKCQQNLKILQKQPKLEI